MHDPDDITMSMAPDDSVTQEPRNSSPLGKRDIAAEAYADALRFLEREFQGNTKALNWLKSVTSTSLQDLLVTTQDAEKRYAQAAQNKSSSKAWLKGLSKRVMHYGNVLDVLSQHHPEYLALVWGLAKFVLMGIINHGNLVTQFSQALSQIAQVLPKSELSAELYQTDQMKVATAELYAHILLFLQQAVKWYNVGPAGRALTALFNPFELRYRETVEQIMLCAHQIDEISSLASKVEIREIKVLLQSEATKWAVQEEKLHEMQAKFSLAQEEISTQIGTVLRMVSCSASILNDVHVDVKDIKPRVLDIHFNHILDVLKPRRMPEETLRAQKAMVRRSSPWRSQNQNTRELFQSVGQWVVATESSLLVLQTQPRGQARVKEIATELICLLQPQSKKLIWYLSDISLDNQDGVSTLEILKSLVFQSLRIAPDLVVSESGNFSTAKLHGTHSETEWLELLCHIIQHLNSCFIFIEAEDVFRDDEEAKQLIDMTQELMGRLRPMTATVKLLVVNYSNAWPEQEYMGLHGRFLFVKRESPVPPRRRKPGARSLFYGSNWSGIGRTDQTR